MPFNYKTEEERKAARREATLRTYAKRKERYEHDPVFREEMIARNRAAYLRNKERYAKYREQHGKIRFVSREKIIRQAILKAEAEEAARRAQEEEGASKEGQEEVQEEEQKEGQEEEQEEAVST